MTDEELLEYLRKHGPLPQPRRGIIRVSPDGTSVGLKESIRVKAKQTNTKPNEVQNGGETTKNSER
jgi:hypothetical protein